MLCRVPTMMVSAPWSLLSPTGVLYYVRDEVSLRTLARDENLIVGSGKKNLLRQLVDPANKKCLDKLPRHRAHWQLLVLQRVQWLQCVETEECVPVVGGDGDYFVKKFACAREDMQAFDGSRLNQLLNKGWLWRHGEQSNIYTQKSDSSLRWKRLDEPPADASSLLPSVPLPSPYALPVVVAATPTGSTARGKAKGVQVACKMESRPLALWVGRGCVWVVWGAHDTREGAGRAGTRSF